MPSLMERVQNLPWIRVDASGNSQDIQMDKVTMMRRFDLPASDFLLLDPPSDSPSAILVREKAIVVKLEQIGCIITADEVLLLSPHRPCVMQYVAELQRRLNAAGMSEVSESECADLSQRRGRGNFDNNSGNSSPEHLPFEFRALEVALQATSTFLHSQVSEFEEETENLFVEIDSMIVTWQLAKVRSLKSKLAALTRRLQMVRDEIERLVNDKVKMADMYLAEKKRRMESTSYGDQSLLGNRSTDGALSVSAPVPPVASPPDGRKLEKSKSIGNSRHNSTRSSEISRKSTQLEMLLETYFVLVNTTLNKVPELKEVIDDIGFFINIEQDSVRNKLIRFELLMITATFIVAIFGVVAGIFGMNFPVPLFHNAGAFKWVLTITGAIGITIFLAFYCFFKYRRLMLQ